MPHLRYVGAKGSKHLGATASRRKVQRSCDLFAALNHPTVFLRLNRPLASSPEDLGVVLFDLVPEVEVDFQMLP